MQPPIEQNNNEDFSLMQRQDGNDTLKSLENTSEMALMQREETNSKLNDISRTLDMQLEQSSNVQKVQITPPETDEDELLDWAKSSFIQMLRGPKGKEGKPGQDSKPEQVANVLKNDEEFINKTKGEDGYSPIKGRDYDDGKDGYTPVKGVDYFDGKDSDPVEVASLIKKDNKFIKSLKGEKGDTPIIDTEVIAKKVAKQINIKPETTETIIEKIKDKFSFSDLKDIPMYLRKIASKTVSLLELDDVSVNNPTNGQSLTYSATLKKWVNSTISASGITLKTNGTDNVDQTLLNLVAGTNITLTDNGTGSVTIDATGGGGGGSGTVNSGSQYRLAYYATTGTAVSQAAAITADRVLISDANGVPTHSAVTTTTLAYLDATSSIQTQLNAKQATITFGTGVQTALGVNVGTAGSPVINGGALGTPSSGTLTNATGLPIAGLVSSTSTALGVGSLEVGHASDTTLSRSSAGVMAVEGVVIPSISSTNTLTNKRITKRVGTTTSSATPTINTDNVDMYTITAQTVDITSFTTNLSGTPTDGQTLWIAITGTAARAITWGTFFEASTVALPTTTVSTNRLDVGFVWNSSSSKWRCVASA